MQIWVGGWVGVWVGLKCLVAIFISFDYAKYNAASIIEDVVLKVAPFKMAEESFNIS